MERKYVKGRTETDLKYLSICSVLPGVRCGYSKQQKLSQVADMKGVSGVTFHLWLQNWNSSLDLSTHLALFRSSLPWFQLHLLLFCVYLAHKCTRQSSVPWPFLLATKMMKIGIPSKYAVSSHLGKHSSQVGLVLRSVPSMKNTVN